MLTLYADTDQVIEVPDVTDRDVAAQTDATVVMTVYRNDVAVGDPIDATHTGDGTYEVYIEDGLGLAPGERGITYRVVITLADGETQTVLADRMKVAHRSGS